MAITRYRKKPVEVDTIQWTGDNEPEVQAFTGGASNFYALDDADRDNSDDPEAIATVFDKLHSTWILVYTGQHIVRGVKGEYYPIAEDVLAETYELATPAPAAAETVTAARVSALYERWVKAGPPPLGVSLARWWDARLVELHGVIAPAATEATEPHTGLVVQPYTENGEQKWVFRCWGTDDGCDGWLSLDHYSEQSAVRARDRHAAEEHPNEEQH